MDKQQRFHGTDGSNMKHKVCDYLAIHSFNQMTSSEYPAYSNYYRDERKEKSGSRIYNHDILF
ncbi:MAG: hypothetical protein GX339_02725 [Tissierellia bacterium]|nr:hypothetical protein [Tissierellia bacterium]